MSDLQTISDQAAADNRNRRERLAQARKANEEQIAHDRDATVKRNLAKMEAEAKLRPTPTPEEVLQARAGHNVDIKEPDGAPLQNPNHPIANAAQQIEVGRQIPTAQPVDADQNSQLGRAHTDRSDMSPSTASPGSTKTSSDHEGKAAAKK